MKLFGKICVIIISVLIVLLLVSPYLITLKDGSFDEGDLTSTPYVASTYTGSAQISSSGIITKTTSEELWNQMIENKNNIENYLDSPEELEKLMNAEIITQYPKIDNADEGALNGIIEFQRNKTDGKSSILTYMNKDTFDSYINSNSIKTSDGKSILDYFTLDDDGNAVVAVMNTETYKIESNDNSISIEGLKDESIDVDNLTEDNKKSDGTYYNEVYNVESKKIDYKSMVQNYTMPFQYLWALLVIGEDKEFVLELADLVENSEITISIYDNIATTEYEDVYTYKKETRIDKYAKISVDNDYGVTGYLTERYWLSDKSPKPDIEHYTPPFYSTYVTDEGEYNVTITKIYKTNTFVNDLTKANVWVVDYSKDYEYLPGSAEKENNSKNLDNTEYVFDKDTSKDSKEDDSLLKDSDALSFAASMKSYIEKKAEENKKESAKSDSDKEEKIEVNATVSYVRYKNYIHKSERKQSSETSITEQKYVAGKVANDPKVDVNADEDNPNFVSILNKPSHKNAKYLITSEITSWLMEILETNPDTKNMVDLTKLLINKVSEKEKFEVNEDDIFSEYEYSSFEDYTSYYGDYVVRTNDSNSATVVRDRDEIEKGLKKWLKNTTAQKENALSVLDTVLECQEEYHVNAVFVYAFLRVETGIGTANTGYVKNDNNWGSWALGRKYSSPEENIKTITKNMESGNIYFTQGNISVSKIGAIYCPNDSEYPTQGDDWIKNVTNYMTDLYSCMGIAESTQGTVSNGTIGTIGTYTSTQNRTYKLYIQGNPAPWANEDYGDSRSMAKAGCGPTAAAIIASSYDAKIDPSDVRQSVVSMYGLGNHSSATWIGESIKKLLPNVKVEVANYNEEKIKQCLNSAGQAWFVVQNCKYTSGAHCMALIDYKEPGMVYVAHGTANSRPYGWNKLSELKSYNKYGSILYVGGK